MCESGVLTRQVIDDGITPRLSCWTGWEGKAGNTHLTEAESVSYVAWLLEIERCFSDVELGIQLLVIFEKMCTFMTRLYEVTGYREDEFPGCCFLNDAAG